jgi:hypothetical protein
LTQAVGCKPLGLKCEGKPLTRIDIQSDSKDGCKFPKTHCMLIGGSHECHNILRDGWD